MSQPKSSSQVILVDNEDAWLQDQVQRSIWTGPFSKALEFVDSIYNWGRRSSIWPMQFGLACCAIEMICASGSRFDISRFGSELFRPSPRQADLMIVAGTVTKKMVPAIVRLWNQMAEPKYVMAMGACASGGGPFKEGYNVVSGIDKFLPVDVYVPGCPPTPQALLFGLMTLQKRIDAQSISQVPWYRAGNHQEIPEPVLGPDIYDPRRSTEIKELSTNTAKRESRYVHIVKRAELKHGKKEEGAPAAAASGARPGVPAPTARPTVPGAPAAAGARPAVPGVPRPTVPGAPRPTVPAAGVPKPAAPAVPPPQTGSTAERPPEVTTEKAQENPAPVVPGDQAPAGAHLATPRPVPAAKPVESTPKAPVLNPPVGPGGEAAKVEAPARGTAPGPEGPKVTPIPQPAATRPQVTPPAARADAKGKDEENPRTINVALPATPQRGAHAPTSAQRGEKRSLAPSQPDRLMSERRGGLPVDVPATFPTAPQVTPQRESRLEALKADADYAARQRGIIQQEAMGQERQAAASALAVETELAAKMANKPEAERKEVEPTAGESKEAARQVQPTQLQSKVATEEFPGKSSNEDAGGSGSDSGKPG